MHISQVKLINFKSFREANLEFSKGINLIIGPNNAGKSTLLKSVAWLQKGSPINKSDFRISKEIGSVNIKLEMLDWDPLTSLPKEFNLYIHPVEGLVLETNPGINARKKIKLENNQFDFSEKKGGTYSIPNSEPKNLMYLYSSKRKVDSYEEKINLSTVSSVTGNFSNLYAKIDRLSNPAFSAHDEYIKACQEILGFEITAIHSYNGKKAVYTVVDSSKSIPLDEMGEGIASSLGLIVDLCVAEDKVFLIEEPENDIHPKALKKLLNLIAEKSETNQFIITTHSNIVVKYLGAQENAKLFQVTMEFENRIPTSQIKEVDNSPEARLGVLEELGYEFFDFDMWTAWLILEESSAEKIIREYLIRWFAPELIGKLRTYSARSLDEVKNKFEYFNNLFVFIHLQSIYKNLAWVIIDEGDKEKEIIESLIDTYTRSGWEKDQFLQFQKHNFEQYYPQVFQSEVEEILRKPKKSQRHLKKQLLDDVEKWIKENPVDEVQKAFEDSASEVIKIIQDISSKISERAKKI